MYTYSKLLRGKIFPRIDFYRKSSRSIGCRLWLSFFLRWFVSGNAKRLDVGRLQKNWKPILIWDVDRACIWWALLEGRDPTRRKRVQRERGKSGGRGRRGTCGCKLAGNCVAIAVRFRSSSRVQRIGANFSFSSYSRNLEMMRRRRRRAASIAPLTATRVFTV